MSDNFFKGLQASDILTPIEPLLRNNTLLLGNDGIIRSRIRARMIDNHWIYTKHAPDRLCGKWMRIYWDQYRLLAKGCMGCWKISLGLSTLKQALVLRKIQKDMDLPSKVGMDKRFYTRTPFSAHWYCPISGGLDGARELYQVVKERVFKELDGEVPIILKRGCTELEIGMGPSDCWIRPNEAEDLEELLDRTFEDPPPQYPTTSVEKVHIYCEWKRYWDVVKVQLLDYSSSIHNPKDFPIPIFDREVCGAGEINEEETDSNSTGSSKGAGAPDNGQARELTGEDALWGSGRIGSSEESKLTIV